MNETKNVEGYRSEEEKQAAEAFNQQQTERKVKNSETDLPESQKICREFGREKIDLTDPSVKERMEEGHNWRRDLQPGERRIIESQREDGTKIYEVVRGEKLPQPVLGFTNKNLVTEEILVVLPNQQTFRVSSLMPKGKRLESALLKGREDKEFTEEKDRGKWSAGENGVEYGDFSYSGKLLALLHEIGHLWTMENLSKVKEEFKEVENSFDTTDKTQGDVVNMPEGLARTHFRLQTQGKNIEQRVNRTKYNDYRKAYLGMERDAWAWALRTFDRLRQNGIDLEPKLNNLPEIKKGAINPGLVSHAIELDLTIRGKELRKPS